MQLRSTLTSDESRRLEEDGFLALEGIVSEKQLQAMRRRLRELLDATEQKHAGTLIVDGLLAEETFDPAWRHPRVLAAVKSVLGDSHRLLGVFSRGLRPGHGQQALHADWGGQGQPGVWYVCHAICPLVDFTSENGATRVVPGSHRNPWMMKGQRDLRGPHPAERQLIGRAGTVFILNVHCQHSAVHNGSDSDRLAIFSSFSRRDSPLLLMQPPAATNPDILTRFDADTQRLLRDD
ncbi:MAG: phytanoyl-CoA dioxygenase family protein [Planctomycetaceae bacterium]